MTYTRRETIDAITYDDLANHPNPEDLFLRDYSVIRSSDDSFILTSRMPSNEGEVFVLLRDEVLIRHTRWHFTTVPKNVFDAVYELMYNS